ncbi:hypothetical protein SGLAM104S_01427 [Streptomyces glaucescens]
MYSSPGTPGGTGLSQASSSRTAVLSTGLPMGGAASSQSAGSSGSRAAVTTWVSAGP